MQVTAQRLELLKTVLNKPDFRFRQRSFSYPLVQRGYAWHKDNFCIPFLNLLFIFLKNQHVV